MLYKPNAWVIIKCKTKDETVYKVMGGWYGGYLFGDSWRLNSGIEKVIETDDSYEFIGSSGSVYKCFKNAERMTGYMGYIFEYLKKSTSSELELEVIEASGYIKEAT